MKAASQCLDVADSNYSADGLCGGGGGYDGSFVRPRRHPRHRWLRASWENGLATNLATECAPELGA